MEVQLTIIVYTRHIIYEQHSTLCLYWGQRNLLVKYLL